MKRIPITTVLVALILATGMAVAREVDRTEDCKAKIVAYKLAGSR